MSPFHELKENHELIFKTNVSLLHFHITSGTSTKDQRLKQMYRFLLKIEVGMGKKFPELSGNHPLKNLKGSCLKSCVQTLYSN